MKGESNYKSKKTLLIGLVIAALLAVSVTGIFVFTKGDDDARAYTTEDGRTIIIDENGQEIVVDENGNPVSQIDTENNSSNVENTTSIASTTNNAIRSTQENVVEEITIVQEEVGTDGLYLEWEKEDVLLSQFKVNPKYTATFVEGNLLNGALKGFYGEGYKRYSEIKSIKRETDISKVNFEIALHAQDPELSTTPIYVWQEGDTAYYYSKADIVYLNPLGGKSFSWMPELSDISGLSKDVGFDTSKCTDLNRLFQDDYSLVDLTPLAGWDVSKVTDMSFMLGSMYALGAWYYEMDMRYTDLSPLKNWDVSSVRLFDQTFKGAAQIETLEPLRNWNVSNATDMKQMFNRSYALSDISAIKDWDVSNVDVTIPSHGFDMMMQHVPAIKQPFTVRPGIWNQKGTYIPTQQNGTNSIAPLSFSMAMPMEIDEEIEEENEANLIENLELEVEPINNIEELIEIEETNTEIIIGDNETTEDVIEEVTPVFVEENEIEIIEEIKEDEKQEIIQEEIIEENIDE